MMPSITNAHLKAFRQIKERFGVLRLDSPSKWRKFSNDKIWIRIVSQVVVVGRAEPAEQLWEKGIRRRIGWKQVTAISRLTAEEAIWRVLRDIGTRYCSEKGPRHDRKTAALMSNLEYLRNQANGPRGFLKAVAKHDGSLNKVHFVKGNLSYIKDKGARDLLMSGFAMVKDCIAFDTRILKLIKRIGIRIPPGVPAKTNAYEEFEKHLIEGVCRPLKISGAQFDQLLFRNYDAIMRMLDNR